MKAGIIKKIDFKKNSINPLSIGETTLVELEEMIKAFRIMNCTTENKRLILSRNNIPLRKANNRIINSCTVIDLSLAKLLRRNFGANYKLNIIKPDEGITIVSSMKNRNGIPLSIDLVTQIMNIGGGIYEGLINRVESFEDLLALLRKKFYPKLVIVGYLPQERLVLEYANLVKAFKLDAYLRFLEINHDKLKPNSYFKRLRQVDINTEDANCWGKYLIEVIREYTRPYLTEKY